MMRPVRLAQIAAEAEGLRLRAHVRRTVIRLMLGVLGMVFILAGFAFAHVTAWYWLRQSQDWSLYGAAGAIAGVDLAIALVLMALAGRSTPGRAEQDARDVRQRALAGIATSFTTPALVMRAVLELLRCRS